MLLTAVWLVACCLLPTGSPGLSDTLDMQLIATIPAAGKLAFPCADADRNGRKELYLHEWVSGGNRPVAYEYAGGNQFDRIPLNAPSGASSWAAGFLDDDDRLDLLVQLRHSSDPAALEARAGGVFPDSLVWWDTVGRATWQFSRTMDLTQDGRLEFTTMFGRSPPGHRALYKATGDNRYEQVGYFKALPPERVGRIVHDMVMTHDMDGNGKPEVVGGTSEGWAAFFEWRNDSVEFVTACSLRFEQSTLMTVGAMRDADGDGRPEAVIYGSDWFDDIGTLWVLEAVAPDSYDVVWTEQLVAPAYFGPALAVGDLTGDGKDEFAVTTGDRIVVYHCVGSDSYEVLWQRAYSSNHYAIGVCDVTSNGRAELLLHENDWLTGVYAWLPVSVAERARQRLAAVALEPSVVRVGANVRLVGLPETAGVSLLDATGRVVRSVEVRGGHLGTRGLRAGTYFLRVESGPHAAHHKLLVVN
ncbi:MAG: hypothetical protein R6X14_04025 [bacterium]